MPLRDDGGFCVADVEGEQVMQGRFDVSFQNAEFNQGFLLLGRSDTYELERLVTRYDAVEQELSWLMEALGEREIPASGVLERGRTTGLGLNLIPRDVAAVLAADPSLSDSAARVTVIVQWWLGEPRGAGHAFDVEVCNGCLGCPDGSEPIFPCGPGSPPMVCP
ncbi:MAG: hypothetical protein P1V51_25325 [Deltaproteobacteria bacterium]|nr:hypothetical protein [Deltaproteobacteria bacterium]